MSLWAASKLQLHYRQRNMNCFSFLNSGTSREGKFKKFEIKSKITMYDSAGSRNQRRTSRRNKVFPSDFNELFWVVWSNFSTSMESLLPGKKMI